MSDVIIFWENPPAPEDLFPIIGQNGKKYKNTLGHYHAGCCPNCRCLASPVIFIDDLKFPVRVYTQGMIKTMTKKDFLALYNAKVGELKAENAQKKQLNRKPIQEIQSIEKKIINAPSGTILQPKPLPEFPSEKKQTVKYLQDNFGINAELDDFSEKTVKIINDIFTKINNEIKRETGINIQITTIKTIKSSEKIYNQIINDKYIKNKLGEEIIKYGNNNKKEPSNEWKEVKLKEIENNLKEDMGLKEKEYIKLQESNEGQEKNQIKKVHIVPAFYASKDCEEFQITYPNEKDRENLSGLYLSKKFINIFEYQNNLISNQNWNPPNCDNVNGIINHEIGHAIDDFLGLSDNASYNGIKDLYEADLENYKNKLNFLSKYSFYNETDDKVKEELYKKHPILPSRFKEFVAEAISEYLTSENPREISQNVWKIVINGFQNKSLEKVNKNE